MKERNGKKKKKDKYQDEIDRLLKDAEEEKKNNNLVSYQMMSNGFRYRVRTGKGIKTFTLFHSHSNMPFI